MAESDVAKALRTAGFPEIESKVLPENVTNKVLAGIQKRLLKMDDVLKKLADHPQSTLICKILRLCKVNLSLSEFDLFNASGEIPNRSDHCCAHRMFILG